MSKRIYIADAIDWGHSLNRGLAIRLQALPGQQRGVMFRDLTRYADGTLTNGPLWQGSLGRKGGFGSIYVSGGADRVVATLPSLTATGQLTISMWLRSGGTDGLGIAYPWSMYEFFTAESLGIFAGGSALGYNIGFFDIASGNIADTGANTFKDVNVQYVWKHLIVSYDKNAATKTSFYLDGVNLANASDAVTGDIAGSVNRMNISSRYSGTFPWPGNVDDVRFWYGRALSASDASAVYQSSRQQYDPTLNWVKPRYVFDMGGASSPATYTINGGTWTEDADGQVAWTTLAMGPLVIDWTASTTQTGNDITSPDISTPLALPTCTITALEIDRLGYADYDMAGTVSSDAGVWVVIDGTEYALTNGDTYATIATNANYTSSGLSIAYTFGDPINAKLRVVNEDSNINANRTLISEVTVTVTFTTGGGGGGTVSYLMLLGVG